uniref:Uncharacterized protein n=1 Tax=Ditylenchus dipsaci TaxID=166011 RepID=A0A915CX96_9BILA
MKGGSMKGGSMKGGSMKGAGKTIIEPKAITYKTTEDVAMTSTTAVKEATTPTTECMVPYFSRRSARWSFKTLLASQKEVKAQEMLDKFGDLKMKIATLKKSLKLFTVLRVPWNFRPNKPEEQSTIVKVVEEATAKDKTVYGNSPVKKK